MVFWDGAFPSGEFHLQIQNQAGAPIEGAKLNIYQGVTQKYSFKYPFDNYQSENSLISNKAGEIILTHMPRGLEFGGSGWLLFWVIPINMSSPKFDCEITANGYKTVKFSTQQIFETAYNAYKNNENVPEKIVKINEDEFTLAIYQQSIVLKEK